MTKMLHLNWNDYPSSLCDSAKDMKDDKDFMDVTLAFDDNKQICTNKFMLSICSPFFRRILKRNSHLHPLIYLKGIKSEYMRKIIDFIFHGEIHVPEEELEAFLENAKDLEFEGLSTATPTDKPAIKSEPQASEEQPCAVELLEIYVDENTNKRIKLEQVNYSDEMQGDLVNNFPTENESELMDDNNDGTIILQENSAAMSHDNFYTQYDEEIVNLFRNDVSENGMFKCKACGKEFSNKDTLKKHTEIHMDNLYQCDLCLKTFGTKNSFNVHKSRTHKNSTKKK